MKVETEKLIEQMFDNKRQYQIPVYQRNYDWKKDNCLELFSDVINAYDNGKSHFLGTIVQVQQDEENGIKRFVIIDGQQRMTSIYLLLKALYDKSEGDVHEILGDLIYNYSTSKKYNNDEKHKLKLKPIKSDNEQFLLLMNNKITEMEKTSNIYINYKYFCSLIDEVLQREYEIKNIKKGLEYLQIVMISLQQPNDDPQVIFERINSTGEDLKLSDLIRNYLLMTDENMENLYEEYWLPIENLVGRDYINDYFSNYLIFKLPEINDKKAYQQFKKYADNEKISHEDILKELKRYSKYYSVFIRFDLSYSKGINNLLDGYRILKQSTIFPFLFSVFNDFEDEIIDEEILENILIFFLNYTIRRIVTGVPSNSLRGFYKSLYKRIFNNDSLKVKENYLFNIYNFMANILSSKDVIPNDTNFKDSLMKENIYKNNGFCKFLLSILENGLNSIKEKVYIDSSISIEHIMPQNKDNDDWKNEIGQDYSFVYDKYLHTLGNLTLTGYNSELSDNPFKEKVRMIKEKSKFIILNQDVIDKEHWSESSIISRAERLSSLLVTELSLPEAFKNRKSLKQEEIKHSFYENYDFTNCKPVYFILDGERKDVSSATDMLVKVCESLYEMDSDKMSTMGRDNFVKNNGTTPIFSYDISLLRSGKEIDNTGIYVETNRSFNDILRTVKFLIQDFGLSFDDFFFYTFSR